MPKRMDRRDFLRMGAIIGGGVALGLPGLPILFPRRGFLAMGAEPAPSLALERMLTIHSAGGISSNWGFDAMTNAFVDDFNARVGAGAVGAPARYRVENEWIPNTATLVGQESVVPVSAMSRAPYASWRPAQAGFADREFGPVWGAVFGADPFFGSQLGLATLAPLGGHDVCNKVIVCGASNPYFKSWSALIAARIAEAAKGAIDLPFVILNGNQGYENVTLNQNFEVPFIFGGPESVASVVQSATGSPKVDAALQSGLEALAAIGAQGSARAGVAPDTYRNFGRSLASLDSLAASAPTEASPRYLYFYLRIMREICRATAEFFDASDSIVRSAKFDSADLRRGDTRAAGGYFSASDYGKLAQAAYQAVASLPDAEFRKWERDNRKAEASFARQADLIAARDALRGVQRSNGRAAEILSDADQAARKLATALFLFTRNLSAVVEAYLGLDDTHDCDGSNAVKQLAIFGGVKAVLAIAREVDDFGGVVGKSLADFLNGSVTTEFDREPNLYVNSNRETPGTDHGSATPVVYFGPRFATGQAFGGKAKGTRQEIAAFGLDGWRKLSRFAPLPMDAAGRIARPEDGGRVPDVASIAPTMLKAYGIDVPPDQKNASSALDFMLRPRP